MMINGSVHNWDAKEIGTKLANTHSQTLSIDLRNGTLMNGQYLYAESRKINMPNNNEIYKALVKADTIVQHITTATKTPFVGLQNWYAQKIVESPYGNPAWDIGIVINFLNDCIKSEIFLREYLSNRGVFVTVIELYIGILYAKLYDSIMSHNEDEWHKVAQNECSSIVCGSQLAFKEVSAETLSNIGLPGLYREIMNSSDKDI